MGCRNGIGISNVGGRPRLCKNGSACATRQPFRRVSRQYKLLDDGEAVILARLAVPAQDQGRGIGFGLLQEAIRRTTLIAEQAGIRAMLTHPIDENAAGFYTRFGFIASPLREQQLLLLLKVARRWVR